MYSWQNEAKIMKFINGEPLTRVTTKGYARRNFLVPIPVFADFEGLNAHLLELGLTIPETLLAVIVDGPLDVFRRPG